MSAISPFAPIRRIVTGHLPNGRSTVTSDDKLQSLNWRGASNKRYTRLWVTRETPADNNSNPGIDMRNFAPDRGVVQTGGSHFICMELAPGGKSDMHRTDSIDYMILISGHLSLVLDDGKERTITEPGSVVVQRGTMHRWYNPSKDQWAKYVIVVVDAAPTYVQAPNGQVVALQEGARC